MVRDRLAELKKCQDDLGGEEEVVVKMEVTAEQASMERFFTKIEEVQEGLRKIEEAVSQVRKKHSEILSSSHNETDLKRELDDLTADIKRTGAKVNVKLKELSPKEKEDVDKYRAEFRIRKTQHGAATRRFVEIMTEYHHVQENYRDRCRETIRRQLQITGKNPNEEELDEILEKENPEIFTQGIMMETQQVKQQLAAIEERHHEIKQLETSLREVHDLFMDMAVMVHSQGEILDNIATHVANTRDYVETAKVETGQALAYQGKARKKKIICLVILLVVLVILAVAIAISV